MGLVAARPVRDARLLQRRHVSIDVSAQRSPRGADITGIRARIGVRYSGVAGGQARHAREAGAGETCFRCARAESRDRSRDEPRQVAGAGERLVVALRAHDLQVGAEVVQQGPDDRRYGTAQRE